MYVSVYMINTGKEFVRTLRDEIRKFGAMDKLTSDGAQAEVSNKVRNVLQCSSRTGSWNPTTSNRTVRNVTSKISRGSPTECWVLNRLGAPSQAWYGTLPYHKSYIRNRMA